MMHGQKNINLKMGVQSQHATPTRRLHPSLPWNAREAKRCRRRVVLT